jgi:glycosyltransferase 2 family protein
MVGSFYNTFLLGSTGGDVIKAYYAARQTTHKTRAVLSVIIDRILGLLAIVMLAGVMATFQYVRSPSKDDPTSQACMHVALFCVAMMAGVGMVLAILFQPTLRSWLGLEFILSRMPMQRQVNHAREVMRMYRRKPVLILWALIITIPVHVTTVISALLAGKAFGLPIQSLYYFTVVPVVVLAGSMPISPQGAGVMEGFAFLLTQKQGATVNDAVALTMSIRLVQIMWNLTGGIFVLRGGYHAPTEMEQKELEGGEEEETSKSGEAENSVAKGP